MSNATSQFLTVQINSNFSNTCPA